MHLYREHRKEEEGGGKEAEDGQEGEGEGEE